MPLNLQVFRDDQFLEGGPGGKGYGGATLNACYTVAVGEGWPHLEWRKGLTIGEVLATGQIGEFGMLGIPYLLSDEIPLSATGEQTVENDHEFPDTEDGDLVFKKGDVIKAWRS